MKPRAVAGLLAIAVVAGLQVNHPGLTSVSAANPAPGTITTIAGARPNSGPATTVNMQPWGVALFGSTLYLGDLSSDVVRAVDTNTDVESVVAGNGLSGTSGDGGPARAAALNGIFGLAVDTAGNLYIGSVDRVRMVTTAGIISTLATGFSGPLGLALDAAGNVFVADSGNNRIARIDHSTMAVTTVAGNGTAGFSGDGGPPIAAMLNAPQGVAVDPAGNLWIADTFNDRIRQVTSGTINTVAGVPTNTASCASGSTALTTPLIFPTDVTLDAAGNAYVTDTNENCIRKLTGTSLVTVAGTGQIGYSGDGGPASSARLAGPIYAALDGAGNLFFADNLTYRVRKITSGGIITTIAGTGFLAPSVCTLSGDGDLATSILLCDTSGVAVDGAGDVFFSDGVMNVVREITTTGLLKTIAGTGVQGHSGDGGPGTSAQLGGPGALAVDPSGDVLIAERVYPATIRMVDTSGVIHTIAGGGTAVAGTTPVPATSVGFGGPSALAVAPYGDLYSADAALNAVSRMSGPTLARFAGGGPNFPGDGGPATLATLYSPAGVALDGSGNVYISSPGGSRLHKVDASGTITTVHVFAPETGPGAVEIAPTGQIVLRTASGGLAALTPAGLVAIAGNGMVFSGDGGPAYLAGMDVGNFVFDSAGDIFVDDLSSYRIRRIQAFTAPGAPVSVSATPGIHSATVQWSAPAANGGAPVVQYLVRSYQGATPGPTATSGAPTAIVGGLAANVPYTFTVTAFNGMFNSPPSTASSPVVPSVLTAPGSILTYAGAPGTGPATSLGQYPYSVAVVGSHLYIGDGANPVIRDVDFTTGHEGVLVGNNAYGYSGDGGLASRATINGAGAMAYCGGQLYFADTFNFAIRKVDAGGHISTVAGNGIFGFAGNGGPATLAEFGRVFGLACRTGGGLYISDSDNGAVRVIDAAGVISNLQSGFSFPTGIVELGAQNVVAVSDSGADSAIWEVTGSAVPTLLAGYPGLPGYSGDGGPAGNGQSQVNDPRGLTVLGASLYISDRGNNLVRALNMQSGIITTPIMLYANYPNGLVADPANNRLFIASSGGATAVRYDVQNTASSVVAGNGTLSLSGDGGPAAEAQLGNPFAVAVDAAGDVFIADSQNSVIREIDPTGIITTAAGSGVPGYSGDGGPARAATLSDPRSVAVAPNGDLYIGDSANHAVRKVDHSTGLISTVVGGLQLLNGIAVDAAGALYFADTTANIVYRRDSTGVVVPVAGTGTAGFSGDGGPANQATLHSPLAVALDSASNVYISDRDNERVRRVDHATGVITTVAGNGKAGFAGDGHAATSAELDQPFGMAVDGYGNLYIADVLNSRIRLVDTHGLISTVVGTCGGGPGFSGDGGPASSAQTDLPFGLALDGFGDLYIADTDGNRVRAAANLAGIREASCPGPSSTAVHGRLTPSSVASSPLSRVADAPAAGGGRLPVWAPGSPAGTFPLQSQRASVGAPPSVHERSSAVATGRPAAGSVGVAAPGARTAVRVAGARSVASLAEPDLIRLLIVIPALVLAAVLGLRRRRSRSPSPAPLSDLVDDHDRLRLGPGPGQKLASDRERDRHG